MSKQFYATRIFYLLEAVADFPKGSVFCIDEEGEWFYYVQHKNEPVPIDRIVITADPKEWPRRLYRDYWRYINVKCGGDAPYFEAIRNANFKTIREFSK